MGEGELFQQALRSRKNQKREENAVSLLFVLIFQSFCGYDRTVLSVPIDLCY